MVGNLAGRQDDGRGGRTGRPSPRRQSLNGQAYVRPIPVDLDVVVGGEGGNVVDGRQGVTIASKASGGNVHSAVAVPNVRPVLPKPQPGCMDAVVRVYKLS